ncbi:hypothetical protein CHCC20335_2225 [Bacillus paralicheniformis]|nr:hypothetical protein CHCC20335_2225 [Bacillus paralicheniformis]
MNSTSCQPIRQNFSPVFLHIFFKKGKHSVSIHGKIKKHSHRKE